MNIVNLYWIGGTIAPNDTSLPLHHATCGRELESDHANHTKRSHPEISHEIFSFREDLLKESWENEFNLLIESLEKEQEPTDSKFWKTKLIHYFALTSLYSLTFIPFDWTSDETLFIQKDVTSPLFTGYFAPYLSEKKQRKWGCIKIEDCVTHELNNAQNITPSLQWVNYSNLKDIENLLTLFLTDSHTAVIYITVKQAVSPFVESESYATHCWIKREQILQLSCAKK
jgi:hypothetical protein